MSAAARPARTRGANGRFASAPTAAAAPDPAGGPAAAAPGPAGGPAAAEPDAVHDPAVAPTPQPLELYLVRHADAGDSALWPGDDAERPLSKKGRRQAKALGRTLKELGLRVDAVITSPLVRAAQTARQLAKATGVDVVADERLGYGFGRRELAAIVGQLHPRLQRVVLVGHDPGFTEVASLLTGTSIGMAKGSLARIDLPDRRVRAGGGELRWLLPPDAIAR